MSEDVCYRITIIGFATLAGENVILYRLSNEYICVMRSSR